MRACVGRLCHTKVTEANRYRSAERDISDNFGRVALLLGTFGHVLEHGPQCLDVTAVLGRVHLRGSYETLLSGQLENSPSWRRPVMCEPGSTPTTRGFRR